MIVWQKKFRFVSSFAFVKLFLFRTIPINSAPTKKYYGRIYNYFQCYIIAESGLQCPTTEQMFTFKSFDFDDRNNRITAKNCLSSSFPPLPSNAVVV